MTTLRDFPLDDEVPNGGSQPSNWCVVTLEAPASPLTPGSHVHRWMPSEASISSQSGTDFAIAAYGGAGRMAVTSEAGGLFGAAMLLQTPYEATLDGGSPDQRYVLVGCAMGDTNDDLLSLGFDLPLPVIVGLDSWQQTGYGVPGITSPGGPVVSNFFADLLNGTGTDSVPLDNVFGYPMLFIYQIGT